MTISTNPEWTQTVGQICLSAALELGAVSMGDSLESSELVEMMTRLNSMLAKWSVDANLFRDQTETVPVLATDNGVITLDPSVLDVRTVRHVVSSTSTRLLTPWNRDQFMVLPNRSQTGANPSIYYHSKRIGGDQLFLWPVPSADITLELDYGRRFYFAEGPDQELDVPPEWHEAVLYGLASRSVGIFGVTALDPVKVQRCDAQARDSYQKMLDADRPDFYVFEYDSPVEAR